MKYLFILATMISACALSNPIGKTYMGIRADNQNYMITNDEIDQIFLMVVDQTSQRFGGDIIYMLDSAPHIYLRFPPMNMEAVVLISDVPVFGEREISCNQPHDAWKGTFLTPFLPKDKLSCNMAHVFTHWIALRLGERHHNQGHLYPFFGPGSVDDTVCDKLLERVK